MKKSLLIISFVLISLLAIGAVSANENVTDDSAVSFGSLDVEEQVVDDTGDFDAGSTVDEIKTSSNDNENQSGDILSVSEEDGPENVAEISAESEESSSSGFNATVYAEDKNVTKFVEIIDGTDKLKLENDELFSPMTSGNELSLSGIFNLIKPSNSKKINGSEIFLGIEEIFGGININASQALGDLSTIIKSFDINSTRLLADICDAIKLNSTGFMGELNNLINIIGFELSDVNATFHDFISHLKLNIPDEISQIFENIISGETVHFTDVFNLADLFFKNNNVSIKNIIASIGNVTGGFNLNLSGLVHSISGFDFNKSVIESSLLKMFNSFHINDTKILNAFTAISGFNLTKIADAIAEVTGISSDKILNIAGGFEDIFNGINLNYPNIIDCLNDVAAGFSINSSGLYKGLGQLLNSVTFNSSFVSDSFSILFDEFDIYMWDVMSGLYDVSEKLGLIWDDVCEIIGLLGEENFSVMDMVHMTNNLLDENNLSVSDLINELNDFTNGFTFNISNIASKLLDPEYNSTPIKNALYGIVNSISFYKHKLADAFTAIVNSFSVNMTHVVSEVSKMLNGVNLNLSSIFNGFVKIIPQINFNASKIWDKVSFNNSIIFKGIDTVIAGLGINVSKIVNDIVKKKMPEVKASKVVTSAMTTKAIDTAVDGKKGQYFVVKLVDADGKVLANKSISIGFNGKTYVRQTDGKGICKLQINIKNAGTYSVSACFLGDDAYKSSFTTSKIVVKKQTAKLVTKKTTYKVKTKKKTLKATFKTAKGKAIKGKVIKFKVKGKTYKAKTNKKGVAKVNVKLKKKGTYKVTVSYAGDKTYNKITKKLTLKIK